MLGTVAEFVSVISSRALDCAAAERCKASRFPNYTLRRCPRPHVSNCNRSWRARPDSPKCTGWSRPSAWSSAPAGGPEGFCVALSRRCLLVRRSLGETPFKGVDGHREIVVATVDSILRSIKSVSFPEPTLPHGGALENGYELPKGWGLRVKLVFFEALPHRP
jgi:hypothetical protein